MQFRGSRLFLRPYDTDVAEVERRFPAEAAEAKQLLDEYASGGRSAPRRVLTSHSREPERRRSRSPARRR